MRSRGMKLKQGAREDGVESVVDCEAVRKHLELICSSRKLDRSATSQSPATRGKQPPTLRHTRRHLDAQGYFDSLYETEQMTLCFRRKSSKKKRKQKLAASYRLLKREFGKTRSLGHGLLEALGA